MIKFKKPNVGMILLMISFVALIIGFILYFQTFSIFHYQQSKITIAMTIIAFWGLLFLIVNDTFFGERPLYFDAFYVITSIALMFALAYFIIPCISPIAIYFTVNMGDIETYKLGISHCIPGFIFYFIAIVLNIVASFIKPTNEIEIKESEVQENE